MRHCTHGLAVGSQRRASPADLKAWELAVIQGFLSLQQNHALGPEAYQQSVLFVQGCVTRVQTEAPGATLEAALWTSCGFHTITPGL